MPADPKDRGQTNHNVGWRHHERSEWWSQTGSNRRPHACKARALPTELWPQYFFAKGKKCGAPADDCNNHREVPSTHANRAVARIWLAPNASATGLLAHAKRPLVGSPHRPQDQRSEDVQKGDAEGHQIKDLVGRGGLEPPTSRLSGVRSNHLSYRPISEHGTRRPRSSG